MFHFRRVIDGGAGRFGRGLLQRPTPALTILSPTDPHARPSPGHSADNGRGFLFNPDGRRQ